jgi:hypothetical protein
MDRFIIGHIGHNSHSVVADGEMSIEITGGKRRFTTDARSITVDGERITLAPGEEREAGGYLLRGTDHGIEGEQR